MTSHVENIDCMEAMREIPDKYFDLAIVDPPYGIGADIDSHVRVKPSRPNSYTNYPEYRYEPKGWDNKAPTKEYFTELFRVSKLQIIWGANYFTEFLPSGYGWIFWNKLNGEGNDFSDGEFAFCNKGKQGRMFSCSQHHASRGGKDRIHPTQKPVALYKWLIKNYASLGDKILDTHMGSQSSRIAAYDMGFDYWGYEIDKDYFEAGRKRFELFKSQLKLELA